MIGIVFVVLMLMVVMNILIVFLGEERVIKVVKFFVKNFVMWYLVLFFLFVFMLGNLMFFMMVWFLLEYYKFSYYAV